jgi:hypothetical protein
VILPVKQEKTGPGFNFAGPSAEDMPSYEAS